VFDPKRKNSGTARIGFAAWERAIGARKEKGQRKTNLYGLSFPPALWKACRAQLTRIGISSQLKGKKSWIFYLVSAHWGFREVRACQKRTI